LSTFCLTLHKKVQERKYITTSSISISHYLCGACSGQANTLAIWLSSLILSTQNWPLGKTTPFISKLPSGCISASIAFPTIVKLSDFGQLGNPNTISMADDAFGSKGGASAVSSRFTQVFLLNIKDIFMEPFVTMRNSRGIRA